MKIKIIINDNQITITDEDTKTTIAKLPNVVPTQPPSTNISTVTRKHRKKRIYGINIEFPDRFTVSEISKKLNVPYSIVYYRIRKSLKEGEIEQSGSKWNGKIVYQRKNAKNSMVSSYSPQAFLVTQVSKNQIQNQINNLAA